MDKLHNKNTIIKILIYAVIILLIGWGILIKNETRITKISVEKQAIASKSEGYTYFIDNLEHKGGGISITKDYIGLSGWIIKKGVELDTASIRIVLRNVVTNDFFLIPTAMVSRKDITSYINDGFEYDNCGFSVKIPINEVINTVKYDYEIYALSCFNDKERLVPLNTTIKTWEKENVQ